MEFFFFNFMNTYLGHVSFHVVGCLADGNLCRLDTPLKLFQPFDPPENPAKCVHSGTRFCKHRGSDLSVKALAYLPTVLVENQTYLWEKGRTSSFIVFSRYSATSSYNPDKIQISCVS